MIVTTTKMGSNFWKTSFMSKHLSPFQKQTISSATKTPISKTSNQYRCEDLRVNQICSIIWELKHLEDTSLVQRATFKNAPFLVELKSSINLNKNKSLQLVKPTILGRAKSQMTRSASLLRSFRRKSKTTSCTTWI